MRNLFIHLLFLVVIIPERLHRVVAEDVEQDDVGTLQMLRTKKPKLEEEKPREEEEEEEEEERRQGGTTFLLIDVQSCMQTNLAVEGAMEDFSRLANMISSHTDKIDRILATMTTLDKLHISHPNFWINGDGFHPAPYTRITSADVASGKYEPNPRMKLVLTNKTFKRKYFNSDVLDDKDDFDLYKYALAYLQNLEESNRFNHTIWPDHCLEGSQSSAIVTPVMEALMEWTDKTGKSVEWIHRSSNQLTEMSSIMQADVVISEGTSYNYKLLDKLLMSDRLLVAGQSKSHAVNWSLRDVLDWWPDDEASRIALVTDTTSPIMGYEAEAEQLETFLESEGVQLVTAGEAFMDV